MNSDGTGKLITDVNGITPRSRSWPAARAARPPSAAWSPSSRPRKLVNAAGIPMQIADGRMPRQGVLLARFAIAGENDVGTMFHA